MLQQKLTLKFCEVLCLICRKELRGGLPEAKETLKALHEVVKNKDDISWNTIATIFKAELSLIS